MNVLPPHASAEAVFDPPRAWTLRELAAALGGRPDGVVAAMVGRLDLTGPENAVPIEPAALLEAADREAELLGDNRVRCEHVLLGALRALGDADRLERGRADFSSLRADRAHIAYEGLRTVAAPGESRPTAILLAGVPGTGKSTLAEALAVRLRAPVFSMDWQLGALVPFGVLRPDNTEPMADLMLTASVARQLQLGLNVIIDETSHLRGTRRRLRDLAEGLGGRFVGVECVCSDETLQRERLASRDRGIPHWPATVSWKHVQRMRELWEPWEEPHLVVDSAIDPPDVGLRRVLDVVSALP